MDHDRVTHDFEQLAASLGGALETVQDEGTEAFRRGEYAVARALAARADGINQLLADLRGKALEWERLIQGRQRTKEPTSGVSSRSGRLVLRGEEFYYNSAKEAMVIVLRELAQDDPSFLERCSVHPKARGTTRRYIARTPQELYPQDPARYGDCEVLPGGWLVATNNDTRRKRMLIALAAEIAGLTLGKDIVVGL